MVSCSFGCIGAVRVSRGRSMSEDGPLSMITLHPCIARGGSPDLQSATMSAGAACDEAIISHATSSGANPQFIFTMAASDGVRGDDR